MKFIIKHEIKGRIRISLARKFHTVREADVLEQYLLGLDGVTAAKVYERTADAVIYYKEDREAVLVQVAAFDGQITEKQEMAAIMDSKAAFTESKLTTMMSPSGPQVLPAALIASMAPNASLSFSQITTSMSS